MCQPYVNKSSLLIYAYALQQLLLVQEDPHTGSLSSRNSKPYIIITPTHGVCTHAETAAVCVWWATGCLCLSVGRVAHYHCDNRSNPALTSGLDKLPRQQLSDDLLPTPPTTTTNERADSAGTAWKRKPLREKWGLHPHEQLFIWRAGKTQSGRQRSERGRRNCVWKWGQPHMHSMGPLNHLAAKSSWNEAKIRNHPKAAQWFISSGSCRVKSQQPLGK